MIVGSGLVAKGFSWYQDKDESFVFASGVSNSTTADRQAFERERSLLTNKLQENPDALVVYFGTCSVYDPAQQSTPYAKHKLAMEALIQKQCNRYRIFRIPNLAGATPNPHTILNYLYQHVVSGERFELWQHAERNIIDITDTFHLCHYIVRENLFPQQIINIANPVNYRVADIVQAIELLCGKKGNYTLVEKGSRPQIDIEPIRPLITTLGLDFSDGYLHRMIRKYLVTDDVQKGKN